MLVVSYTTVSPLPARMRAVYFLWHWPAGYPEWALPTTLFCGARTFLGTLTRHAIVQPSRPHTILPVHRARTDLDPLVGTGPVQGIARPHGLRRLPGVLHAGHRRSGRRRGHGRTGPLHQRQEQRADAADGLVDGLQRRQQRDPG